MPGTGWCTNAAGGEGTARRFITGGGSLATLQSACTADTSCVAVALSSTSAKASVLYTSTGCTAGCTAANWLKNRALIVKTSGSAGYQCFVKKKKEALPAQSSGCSSAVTAKCQGTPCIDLREGTLHHHIMFLTPEGATIDGEAGGIGKGDNRMWKCKCTSCQGLVGTWYCPGFYQNIVTISQNYCESLLHTYRTVHSSARIISEHCHIQSKLLHILKKTYYLPSNKKHTIAGDDFTAMRANDHIDVCLR